MTRSGQNYEQRFVGKGIFLALLAQSIRFTGCTKWPPKEASFLWSGAQRILRDTKSPVDLPIESSAQEEADLIALYDPIFGAPTCDAFGSSCYSTPSLIAGAGSPEPNAPNTIDSCKDVSPDSVYLVDESIERMIVKTVDGTTMTEGATVQIIANVITASNTSSRTLKNNIDIIQFYYAPDASNPEWSFIKGDARSPGSGSVNMDCEFTLPFGGEFQAIRASYGYAENQIRSCSPGTAGYYDVDDLVFAVKKIEMPSNQPSTIPSTPTYLPSNSPTVARSQIPSVAHSAHPTITPSRNFQPSIPSTEEMCFLFMCLPTSSSSRASRIPDFVLVALFLLPALMN